MTNNHKRQYLHAMGIMTWLPRHSSEQESEPVTAPAQPEDPVPVTESEPLENAHDPVVPIEVDAEQIPTTGRTSAKDGDMALAAAEESREAQIATMDWQTLVNTVRQCDACGLCTTRTQAVFGVGNPQADWLVIGEAPGADEDRLGEPFVGRAGKLLDPMLLAIGLKREQVFIANILKCRPPDNRDPTPIEANSCRPFLERQIALIQPRIILAVGRIAAQNLLEVQTPIGKMRGQVHHFGATHIPVVVTYHPAYLLRSPREKRKSWDDLRLARRVLNTEKATNIAE